MTKIQEILSDLRSVTERSQPNIKFREQMDLIEALERELSEDKQPTPEPNSFIPDSNVNEVEETITEETVSTGTKKGRKTKSE